MHILLPHASGILSLLAAGLCNRNSSSFILLQSFTISLVLFSLQGENPLEAVPLPHFSILSFQQLLIQTAMSVDYIISTNLLFFFSYISPLIIFTFLQLSQLAQSSQRQRNNKEYVGPKFCVTAKFKIICTFFVIGRNSFMFVSITLNFAKLFVIYVHISKKVLYILSQKSQFCHYVTV